MLDRDDVEVDEDDDDGGDIDHGWGRADLTIL